ncbi:MAG TPA: DUF4410 domain-containing protein [Acetobacteraceae bacterium]|nr:DUF4410 domain-containing protein [Acetobacteraceae bacterium]
MAAEIKRRILVPRMRIPATIFLLAVVAGCATRVTSSTPEFSAAGASVPRPTRVLVADFEIDPSAVREDQGIGLRLQRSIEGATPGARTAIAREVQSAITETVVNDLRKAGLPAERAPENATYRPGDLVVTGRVLRIDEGNRTRRMAIGFGAGKSIVEAAADLTAIIPNGPPLLLQSYDGKADSGRKPGMAVGASMAVAESSVGVGALSAVTNVSGETRRSPVGKEAASFGNRLAHDIGQYAAERGWIAASAVPPWTR